MSFEEAYKQYLILGTRHLKKQSLETFTNNFKLHVLPYFKDFDIFKISKNDLIKWKCHILEHNYSNSYNNNLYVCFNQFLDFCTIHYDLPHNELKLLGNFKKKQEIKKTDFYTLSEFSLFIKNVDRHIYKEFFEFLFFTGVRPGECLALRFSDLSGNIITINHTLTSKGGKSLDTPKNKSSFRSIYIDKKLSKKLYSLKRFYCDKYKNERFDYYIFGGLKPLALTTINRVKVNACLKSNIRPITLHQFRHSHATLLLNNGVIITDVSKRLGHSKVSTTLDIYIHSNLEQEKRVVNTLSLIRLKALTNNFKSIFKRIYLRLNH